jgi:hypothetical protein
MLQATLPKVGGTLVAARRACSDSSGSRLGAELHRLQFGASKQAVWVISPAGVVPSAARRFGTRGSQLKALAVIRRLGVANANGSYYHLMMNLPLRPIS